MKDLIYNLLQFKEYNLHNYLIEFLKEYDYTIEENEYYIYAKRKDKYPVCLCAHLDTVFKLPPDLDEIFYDEDKECLLGTKGLGADDRAGVYAIIKLITEYDVIPNGILFFHGEEIGCLGSSEFIEKYKENDGYKFLIELDRRGLNDAVFYDCGNKKFKDFILSFGFWEENYGTFSDISVVAPSWDIAAVNFSVGYFDEHTSNERLYLGYLYNIIIPCIAEVIKTSTEINKFDFKQENIFSNLINLKLHRYNHSTKENKYKKIDNDFCFYCGKNLKLKEYSEFELLDNELAEYNICEICFNKFSNSHRF